MQDVFWTSWRLIKICLYVIDVLMMSLKYNLYYFKSFHVCLLSETNCLEFVTRRGNSVGKIFTSYMASRYVLLLLALFIRKWNLKEKHKGSYLFTRFFFLAIILNEIRWSLLMFLDFFGLRPQNVLKLFLIFFFFFWVNSYCCFGIKNCILNLSKSCNVLNLMVSSITFFYGLFFKRWIFIYL